MFLLSRPSNQRIAKFIETSRDLPLSYAPVGIARQPIAGFRLDELTTVIGRGRECFERAKVALAQWRHFDLGWVELFPRRASIETGTVVAVLVHHLGFWSLNGCRVVYQVGDGRATEFGFAYGTLTNHAESGEEIFAVSIAAGSEDVTYTIRAASKPSALVAKMAYPLTRSLQARFRQDSAAAIKTRILNLSQLSSFREISKQN